jgi:SAM-dependent methyltransferase
MTMDQERIAKYRSVWNNLRVPVRPGPEGLALYREQIGSLVDRSILILGTTPELVDMAIDLGSRRIVCIERDPEIMEALQQLGGRDWGNVQMVVGDWLDERPSFANAFDAVVCDGGLLFLEFPDQWATLFRRVHGCLKDHGVFVAKEWAEPEGRRDYEALVARLITDFSSANRDSGREENLEAYRFLASELRLATLVGATRPDKSFDQAIMIERLGPLLTRLEAEFPDPDMVDIAESALKYLARSRPGTTDTVAGARYEEAGKLLAAQGFRSMHFPLPDRPVSGANYMFAAWKT